MDAIFGENDILVINQKAAKENELSLSEIVNMAKAGIVIDTEDGDYLYDIITKKEFMAKIRRNKTT